MLYMLRCQNQVDTANSIPMKSTKLFALSAMLLFADYAGRTTYTRMLPAARGITYLEVTRVPSYANMAVPWKPRFGCDSFVMAAALEGYRRVCVLISHRNSHFNTSCTSILGDFRKEPPATPHFREAQNRTQRATRVSSEVN